MLRVILFKFAKSSPMMAEDSWGRIYDGRLAGLRQPDEDNRLRDLILSNGMPKVPLLALLPLLFLSSKDDEGVKEMY